MTKKERILARINKLEAKITPLRQQYNEIVRIEAEKTGVKIQAAEAGTFKFKLTDLIFAATSRCECGAGLAYPIKSGFRGSWYCSAILLGRTKKMAADQLHTPPLPFTFYEIKSENQPSQNGATTRPEK